MAQAPGGDARVSDALPQLHDRQSDPRLVQPAADAVAEYLAVILIDGAQLRL